MATRERRVNLSTADEDELQRIEGVDSVRARIIVEHREAHGPFRSWAELEAVMGPVLTERAREAGELGAPEGRRAGEDVEAAPEEGDAEGDLAEVELTPFEVLAALARLDLEAALAYETASELSDDEDTARQLETFARDHRRHLDGLSGFLEQMGDEELVLTTQPSEPLLAGLARVAAGLGPESLALALLANEQLTNLSYEDALAYEWDEELERMLEGFRADEERHMRWLSERHDAMDEEEARP